MWKTRGMGQAGTHQRSWTAGWRSWSCGSGPSGTPPQGWTGSGLSPLEALEGRECAGVTSGARPLTASGGVWGGGTLCKLTLVGAAICSKPQFTI